MTQGRSYREKKRMGIKAQLWPGMAGWKGWDAK